MNDAQNTNAASNTPDILFSLLSYAIGGEYRRDPDELKDPRTLVKACELADFHDLAHLIAGAVEGLSAAPENERLLEAISKKQLHAILRSERIDGELEAIYSLFDQEKIDYVPLKGAVIRNYYPERWMRTSGDVDILVKEVDVKRASDLLCERLSYSFDGNGSHDILLSSPSGIHLELHFNLSDGDIAAEPLSRVWEHARDSQQSPYRKNLSDEMFLFYHIAHMVKHVKHGGCGIKPLLDLAVLEMRGLADGASNGLLKEHGFDTFFEIATKLSRVWFGGEAHDELTKSLEDYILRAGVYGNLQNAVAAGQADRGGKLKYLLSRAFLPYDVMKHVYPVLKKHKWLLPFCHVRRWLGAIFGGRASRVINETKLNATPDTENALQVSRLMSDLGIRTN